MSIELTTLSFDIINLSSFEKHILTVFCFRANADHECWSSIERLMVDTGYSQNTVEKYLKKLRDKNILMYTGSYKGESHRIPVYRINLDHPTIWGDKYLITPYGKVDHPTTEVEITPPGGIHKDNLKNNKKDNGNSFSSSSSKPKTPSVTDKQEYAAGVKGYEWVGEWMKLNKSD